MNVSLSVLALLLVSVLALGRADASASAAERQPRSVGASSNMIHQNSNMIDHMPSKSRIEQEKRQVQEFFTTKNILKTIVKMLFGSQDDVSASSRSVLGMLGKLLDILKNTMGQKSRSGTGRTLRDSAEDAASAGLSMLQGYVKSVLATDDRCVQRYLCQASKEATRDGREMGYVIASVGGYASSYLLDGSKQSNFKSLYDSAMKGREKHEDCAKLYSECNPE